VQERGHISPTAERVVWQVSARRGRHVLQSRWRHGSPFSVTDFVDERHASPLPTSSTFRLHTHRRKPRTRIDSARRARCRQLDYLDHCGWINARTWLAHASISTQPRCETPGQGKVPTPSAMRVQSNRSWRPVAVRYATWKRRGARGLGVDELELKTIASTLMQEYGRNSCCRRAREGVPFFFLAAQPQGTRCAGRQRIGGPNGGAPAWPPELGEIASVKPTIGACSSSTELSSPAGDRWRPWLVRRASRRQGVVGRRKWGVRWRNPGIDVPI